MTDYKEAIRQTLIEIENDKKVKILYACESGSRAWGFPSKDSDYDVRFIYAHPLDWYLDINIEHKRDVIELPIVNQLDVNGWDLRKTLKLFRKSNPPLLEWLDSPIVYHEYSSLAAKLRKLAAQCYSPIACQYHYFKMARGNFRDYLRGDQVWLKKYFYVLRPLLAVVWLERNLGVVPTLFQILVNTVIDDINLKTEINLLLEQKKEGHELEEGPRNKVISDYIEHEIIRLEYLTLDKRIERCPLTTVNLLFKDILLEVWSDTFA